MEQKPCIKCLQFKHISNFKLNAEGTAVLNLKGNIRTTNVCWDCRSLQKKSTYLTPAGKLKYLYKHQLKNSMHRNHSAPTYTEKELIDKFINCPNYLALYAIWKASGFKSELAPSIDRLEDHKGYSFDNIQMITWAENNSKEHTKHKIGTSRNEDLKPVWQYSMSGEFIANYISQNEASRTVEGVTQQTISKCCLGELHRAGKFRWFFSEQLNLEPIIENNYYELIHEYCPITKVLVNSYNSLSEIYNDVSSQTSVRRAIKNKLLYKQRLFSLSYLNIEEIKEIIMNTKGISPIVVYDKEFNFINEFKSCNIAKEILNIADTTIKKYAISKELLNNQYYIRLKFDDEIAEARHRHQLINCKFLGVIDEIIN